MTTDTLVTRMVEIYSETRIVFDDLKKHQSSETVFGINSLIEGEFPSEEVWSFDRDCFYASITEFQFNWIFEGAQKVGQFRR